MKNILYILVLILSTSTIAQETIIPLETLKDFNYAHSIQNSAYYFKDINNHLDKFTGTWKYETATESLEVTFIKIPHKFRSGNYKDVLSGQFKYTQNNITIIDTAILDVEDYGFFIYGGKFSNTNTIKLFYSEPDDERDWQASVSLEYVAPSGIGLPSKLNWQINTTTRVLTSGLWVIPYKVPANLVLVKQ